MFIGYRPVYLFLSSSSMFWWHCVLGCKHCSSHGMHWPYFQHIWIGLLLTPGPKKKSSSIVLCNWFCLTTLDFTHLYVIDHERPVFYILFTTYYHMTVNVSCRVVHSLPALVWRYLDSFPLYCHLRRFLVTSVQDVSRWPWNWRSCLKADGHWRHNSVIPRKRKRRKIIGTMNGLEVPLSVSVYLKPYAVFFLSYCAGLIETFRPSEFIASEWLNNECFKKWHLLLIPRLSLWSSIFIGLVNKVVVCQLS